MTQPNLVSWKTKTLLAGAFALLLEASILSAHASDASSGSVHSPAPTVALTHSPLVMRMSKDEFRIAFGIKGVGCAPTGCHGLVRYRVSWTAEDGSPHWERREVGYALAPQTDRTITVDRQYFDTSESAHTTRVTQVTVDRFTCHGGIEDSQSVRSLVSDSAYVGR